MSEQVTLQQRYWVRVDAPNEAHASFLFAFVPKGLQQERGFGGEPRRVPKYIVTAHQHAGGLVFDWGATQDDPGADREELEKEAAVRIRDRAVWIERVTSLVSQVERWAAELGWSTRRVEKELDDAWVGKHSVAALLLQKEIRRVLLEPVGRSASGTEGVVDLYLMPAYDDIARLFFYDDEWHLHYVFPDTTAVVSAREAQSTLLSKEGLGKVLAQLTQHAA